ncbi:MAG TPA: hypothetical protein VJK02_20745 [Anaerolineales bacterium]|nr:hypothetical protein [Anaerolineales bacterium]
MNTHSLRTHLKGVLHAVVVSALALGATGFSGGFSKGLAQFESALPEGFHDGEQGVVDSKGCTAFGWAADPDDRDSDLEVQILVDGKVLTTVKADLPRPGLDACPEGTCGFGVNLWGLITPGVEHQITAQAYDDETGAWVNLSSTPKFLTCWGYPEGFHDGAEGRVDQYSCNANGWTVDPDYPDRDLQVRVFSDGAEIASTFASLYRKDMDTLGICPGGTCSWYVDLWGVISSDEEHLITAQAYDVETDIWWDLEATPKSLTCQSPPPSTPRIWADPYGEYINGWDWPPGSHVELLVYREAEELYSAAQDADGSGAVGFDLHEGEIDLKAGDRVTLADGETTKELVVTDLAITQISSVTETVSGIHDPAYGFWIHVDNRQPDQVAFTETEWAATFAELNPGEWGEVSQPDIDGDETGFSFLVPNPHFSAFPEQEVVEGWEWPIGEAVHLAIDDPSTSDSPDFATVGVIEPAYWDGETPWLWIDFSASYDVKAGDVVSVAGSSGSAEHTVRALDVTEMDPAENVASGTSAPMAEIHLWPYYWDQPLVVNADGDGNWSGDLDGIGFDLKPGDTVRASIVDDRGNETAVDRTALRPISIDIRPLSELNLAACRYPSTLIPVALLSEEDFDAGSVDPDSIFFGRTGSEAGVVRAGWNDHPMQYRPDVNGDGFRDIVYYFRLGDTGFSCADIPEGKYSVRVDGWLTGWAGDYGVEGVDFLKLFWFFN